MTDAIDAPLSEDYVRRTVAGLKAMNSDHVIPAHCSGDVIAAPNRPMNSLLDCMNG